MKKILYISIFTFLSAISTAQDQNLVDSLLSALKKAPDKEKAEIYNNLAREYNYNEQPEKAIEYVNEAFAYGKDFKNEKEIATSHLIFGESNYELRKYDIAKQAFEEGLRLSRKIDNKELIADALTSIGSLYDDFGNSDTALLFLNEALEISKEIDYYKGKTRSINIIGFVYYYKSAFSKAIEYFEESYELSKLNNDISSMEINARVLGVCYYRQGNYSKATDRYLEALRFSDKMDNPSLVAGNMLNIANVYKQQKYFNEALDYYMQAEKVYKEENDSSRLAVCYNNIGNVLKEKINYNIDTLKKANKLTKKDSINLYNEFNKAINYYDSAIFINEQLNDLSTLPSIYANRAQTLYNLKRFSEAEPQYLKALKMAEKNNDQRQICTILQNAGELYYATENYNKALQFFSKSLELAIKLGLTDLQQNNYKGISDVHEAYKNYKEAFENYKLYIEKKDELFNEESQKTIRQMKEIYESDKKQQQIELLNTKSDLQETELKRQKLQKLFFGVGAIIVVIFLVFAVRQILVIRKKNALLAEQNIQINKQKEEIEAQRDVVMKQKEEITDSIHYAQRIQRAVLPSKELAESILPEHFILFRPRDIVSGDYFWMTKKNNKVITVAADCTGHGVPGAFMSMLGVSFLNEIVNKLEEPESHLILNHLRNYVKTTLDQTGKKDEAKDGMDVALTIYDFENYTVEYSGAYNPLIIVRPGEEEVIEVKADKMPIGIYIKEKESFTKNIIEIKKGDMLYTFSDGYVDQFGGEDGRKFMSKNFKQLLLSIQDKPMAEQREILNTRIDEWRGKIDQIDDIIVLGIRIS